MSFINIDFDDIIYSLQRFGGASVYWNEITSRVATDPRFIVGHLKASKRSRGIPVFSNAQIFHSSHFRSCLSKKTKVISTVHDLNYELGYLKKGLKSFLNINERKQSYYFADALVCISESTKKELLEVYPSLAQRCPIYVVHHGFTALNSAPLDVFDPLKQLGKYVLYVGGRKGYKNFKNALHGFYESKIWKDGVKMVCTGDIFDEKESGMIKQFNLTQYVISLGKVSEAVLGTLYENAHCLLYTSVHEGFGLPLIEAMNKGCPVITSNVSCMPEVAGGGALLVDPYAIDQIAKNIIDLQNDHLRSEIIKKGQERASFFSWDNSAKLHIDIYAKTALGSRV